VLGSGGRRGAGSQPVIADHHRLRDLQRPEQIYQAVIAGLPNEYPPPRSVGRRPNNLPIARDPIIGRDAEVAGAWALLLHDDVRLVTLTGPAGSSHRLPLAWDFSEVSAARALSGRGLTR
jgi:hypothetical protein